MKLNCKAGDLAVIVRSAAGNEGKIVRVVSFAGFIPGWRGKDRWNVESPRPISSTIPGLPSTTVKDKCLRPIRDQPGEDETMSWCDVPSEVAV